MSSNYSRTEVESIVTQIKIEAIQAGLIPADAFMSYHPGNTSQGISGYVDCFTQDEAGYHAVRIDFVPEFTYKMSKNDHARLLNATLRVFHSLRRAAERKQQETEQEPQIYWDQDPDNEHKPFGEGTASIIDLEAGGVIAYVHKSNADKIVRALWK